MKITIDVPSYSVLVHTLAQKCADLVHTRICALHLEALDRADNRPVDEFFQRLSSADIAQVRALVKSIPSKNDRRNFARAVRDYLEIMCKQRGTHRTTRAFLASARNYRQAA